MYGLEAIQIRRHDQEGMSEAKKTRYFRKHFGSTPLDLASQWYDLTVTDISGASLTTEENSLNGLKMFFMAHHYLWAYTKNREMLASLFCVPETFAGGARLWKWIGKIAALKEAKIVWPEVTSTTDVDLFLISVDGTDCKTRETKHPTMPIDRKMKSDKFNKAGWKYEVALSVHSPKIVWIYGPHKGGEHDMTIFRQQLKDKLAAHPGAMASADLGYRTSVPVEVDLLAWPNSMDGWDIRNYKSRIRCRQETLFGRLKFFSILTITFRHSREQHKMAFEAVCVTVQYQMDNGSPIYQV